MPQLFCLKNWPLEPIPGQANLASFQKKNPSYETLRENSSQNARLTQIVNFAQRIK